MALIVKICLTTISLNLPIPCGVLIPSMVWGVLFGRILGIIVQGAQHLHPDSIFFKSCHPEHPCVTPGMYALLGAISALGGVTRMTVSLTVIMFELTGTLNYIVPCMICLVFAKMVGNWAGAPHRGLADVEIKQRAYPFLDPKRDGQEIFGVERAEQVMTRASELIFFYSRGMRIGDIQGVLSSGKRGFPVVLSQDDLSIVGFITRTDLKYALGLSFVNNSIIEKALKHGMSLDSHLIFDRDLQYEQREGSIASPTTPTQFDDAIRGVRSSKRRSVRGPGDIHSKADLNLTYHMDTVFGF
jgi:chloride channel 3/4/5